MFVCDGFLVFRWAYFLFCSSWCFIGASGLFCFDGVVEWFLCLKGLDSVRCVLGCWRLFYGGVMEMGIYEILSVYNRYCFM